MLRMPAAETSLLVMAGGFWLYVEAAKSLTLHPKFFASGKVDGSTQRYIAPVDP
jgi:hypothetical protein